MIGLIAGAVEIVAFVPYIYSIIAGSTTPHRGSWFIWTFLGFVLLVSYYSAGAEETIWVPLIMFIGPLIVTLFSFKYGVGGWDDPLDRYCLVGALIGIACLFTFKSPLIALTVAIFTDIFAAVPTVRKSITHPASEDALAWGLAFTASILNLGAIDNWSFAIAGYPVYATLIFAAICFPLFRHRVNRMFHNPR